MSVSLDNSLLRTDLTLSVLSRNLYTNNTLLASTTALANQFNVTPNSEFPRLEKGRLRLYSMRLCPFAQRVVLLLEYKNIQYETVNIDLVRPPTWFYSKNPLGLVPCLERDEKIVYESSVCSEYLSDVYSGPEVVPSDPYRKAQDKMLLERYSKTVAAYYNTIKTKGQDTGVLDTLYRGLELLDAELGTRGGEFFGGTHPMLIDFNIWPHIERILLLRELFPNVVVKAEVYPKFTDWVNRMTSLPFVKKYIKHI